MSGKMISVVGVMVVGLALVVGVWAADETDETKTEAQAVVHGPGFVDNNGDGYNDNAPDHDGDGIPNGQDSDWSRKQGQGKGSGWGHGQGNGAQKGKMSRGADRKAAADHDGDGIPNGQDPDFTQGTGQGRYAGKGPNFVDNDHDGVCDNRSSGQSRGGHGRRGK
ncbi:hypothetical protein JXQ70_16605 [bacterium]|nr:hypothetical protein [bacterium]